MSIGCVATLLFAQRSAVEELASRMGDSFREPGLRLDGSQMIAVILGALAILAVFWGLRRWLGGDDDRKTYFSPRKLFSDLCAAHGLTRKESRLLRSLARAQGLADPARLFLEPERFDPEALGPALARESDPLRALRERLFAGLPGRNPQAPPPFAEAPAAPILAEALADAASVPGSALPV